jgi:hypothetical protein
MPEPARRFQPELDESVFPLVPFLVSLEAVGIRATLQDYRRIALALRAGGRWNTGQLCGVLASLLVRDPEKEEAFRQHFARFFQLEEEAQEPFSHIDLGHALEDLQHLKESGPPPAPVAPQPPPAPSRERTSGERRTAPRRRLGRKPAIALLLTTLIAVSGALLWKRFASSPPPPRPAERAPQEKTSQGQAPTPAPRSSVPMRLYPNAVGIRIKKVPPDRRLEWSLTGTLIIGVSGYGLWLWWLWRRRNRGPIPPAAGEGLPRLFRTAEIGGAPDPLLDRETLDRLADSLGYFRSEIIGRELDVRASIEATARWGGVPRPVFETRRQIRSVILFEDLFAEAHSWNTVAAELASGLALRGVPLLHGFFRGIPDRFRLEGGLEVHLEDLEDDRRGYLVLVFTDGKGLTSPRAALALETLARWPQVAWMQLEEPRAWDQSAALVARHGLRVFPASRTGLLQVADRFTSEIAAAPTISTPPERWGGLPPRPLIGRLAEYVETLLGDSLLWVQACAMVVPPFSLGLADRVRERFHPDLPPERRQRLLALPGTMRSVGGITFSLEVTAVLREGFRRRRSPAAQEEVLAFLAERIREAEPPEVASRAHQAWEWRLERLRLEHDPDSAIERLAVLSQGPLQGAILGDLSSLRPAPGGWGREPVSIPLPVRPKSRQGKRLLRNVLAGRGLAPPSQPVLLQRVMVATASAVLLGLAAWLIMAWGTPKGSHVTVRSGERGLRALARLEMRMGQSWQPAGEVMQLGDNKGWAVFSDFSDADEYRLFVLANSLNQRFQIPRTGESLQISLVSDPSRLPCSETVPEIGLTIERCLGLQSGSYIKKEEAGNAIRIGFLLQEGKAGGRGLITGFGDTLKLDTLYTLRATGQALASRRGVERIAQDWEPWTKNLTLFYEGGPSLMAELGKTFGPPYVLAGFGGGLYFERRDRVTGALIAALSVGKEVENKNGGVTALTTEVPKPASPKEPGNQESRPTVAAKTYGGPSIAAPQPAGEMASAAPAEPKTQPGEFPSTSRNTNPQTVKDLLSWKVGEYVSVDLRGIFPPYPSVWSTFEDPLPPGVDLNPAGRFGGGRLEGVPTEAGTWEIGPPPLRRTIVVLEPRCPAPGETLCGENCIELQRLSLPFHDGGCFAISYGLQKATAEKIDQPPSWNDESLQPRHYYRLYYEWNENHTALIVRSLKSASRWDRGPEPAPVALVLPVKELMQRKHQFLATDLEVHCSKGVRVASFSSAKRQVFEKLSTSDQWSWGKATDWPNPPARSTDQALTETLGPILKQWEELCARGH